MPELKPVEITVTHEMASQRRDALTVIATMASMDQQHRATVVRSNPEAETLCSCGGAWKHKVGETEQTIREKFEAHVNYFYRPKTKQD